MIDKEWEELVQKQEQRLVWWFRKLAESGYGDISIEIRKKKGDKSYIEIRPTPAIRTAEEQAIFEEK
jgi:hypothetical protein